MTKEYKKVLVSFDDIRMDFIANIGGTFRRFPSLQAAKKAIDKAEAEKPFAPMEVLVVTGRYGNTPKIEKVNITGYRVEKGRGTYRRDSYYFKVKDANGQESEQYFGAYAEFYPVSKFDALKKIVEDEAVHDRFIRKHEKANRVLRNKRENMMLGLNDIVAK